MAPQTKKAMVQNLSIYPWLLDFIFFRVLLPPQRRADLCTKIPKVTKITVKIIMSAHKKLHFPKLVCDKSIDLRLCQEIFQQLSEARNLSGSQWSPAGGQ